ncbi:MAG: hypothetical protein PSX81_12485 [bacterium]|nr:hypothetical protein [bacterium]
MWLGILSSSTILLPLIMGFINLEQLNKPQKFFLGFLIFSLIFEIISIYLASQKINNIVMFRYFMLVDLIFFFWFFQQGVSLSFWFKIFLVLIILYEISINLYTHFHQPMNESIDYFFIISFLYSVIIGGFVLTEIFDNLNLNPLNNYLFWIAFARIFYFLVILFIYVYPMVQKTSFENKSFLFIFKIINTVGNIICNIMYSKSFLCKKTIN